MRLGLFFFGMTPIASQVGAYGRMLDWAATADEVGFSFISVPERHFDRFGGPFPNPALLCAAMAGVTSRIQLRAGSVVLPLHDELRIAEDWSIVDNLSAGRVAMSIGSGWNVNDFVLAPNAYETRRQALHRQIYNLQAFWSSGAAKRVNGAGEMAEIELQPRPVQPTLPVWITSSRSTETVTEAGARGFNLLTHLENQDLEGLARQVSMYRSARETAGLTPDGGVVTLMQHTLVSDDPADVNAAGSHLRTYLNAALDLEAKALGAGGAMSGQRQVAEQALVAASSREAILNNAVQRYAGESGLIGPTSSVRRRLARLAAAGVDEVACLVDFVPDPQLLTRGIGNLATLVQETKTWEASTASAVQAFSSGA